MLNKLDIFLLFKVSIPPVFIFLIVLYSINYIYCQALKTQISFYEAEITLEFNRSLFIIIAAVSLKFLNCEIG